MTFNPISEPVDHILLAGRRSPGLATIRGAGIAARWDERRLYAAGGAFVVYRGQKLSKFTVTLRLYTEQDWSDWHEWRPLVQRPPPPEPRGPGSDLAILLHRPRAKDIWHPILEDLEIRSVVIEAVLQPQQTADGEWSIEIKMIEYRPPQLALTGIEGSDDVEPQNENERRIASQDAEIQGLEAAIQAERDRRAEDAA